MTTPPPSPPDGSKTTHPLGNYSPDNPTPPWPSNPCLPSKKVYEGVLTKEIYEDFQKQSPGEASQCNLT